MTKTINTAADSSSTQPRIKRTRVNGAAHASVNGSHADDAKYAKAQQDFAEAGDGFWGTLGAFWTVPKASSATLTIVKLVSRVILYALGAVATCYVVSWLSAALMAGGIPLFMIMVAEIVTFILGLLAAWTLSDTAVDYVASGSLSRDARRVTGWIGGLFTSTSTFVKQSMTRNDAVVH